MSSTRCRTARRSRRTTSRWRPGSRRWTELDAQGLVERAARHGRAAARADAAARRALRRRRGRARARPDLGDRVRGAAAAAAARGGMLERVQPGLFAQLVVVPLFAEHKILTQVAGHDSKRDQDPAAARSLRGRRRAGSSRLSTQRSPSAEVAPRDGSVRAQGRAGKPAAPPARQESLVPQPWRPPRHRMVRRPRHRAVGAQRRGEEFRMAKNSQQLGRRCFRARARP